MIHIITKINEHNYIMHIVIEVCIAICSSINKMCIATCVVAMKFTSSCVAISS